MRQQFWMASLGTARLLRIRKLRSSGWIYLRRYFPTQFQHRAVLVSRTACGGVPCWSAGCGIRATTIVL